MLIHRLHILAPVAVAVVLAACVPVTVNINFPQQKLEGAADSIEDMVRSPENPKPEPPKKSPGSQLGDRLLAALAPRDASAQVPEIRTRTPELMKAIESRRGRFPQVRRWKEAGCVGENNQGLLERRPGQGCTAEVDTLIAPENADRTYIYDTLMQQNNIPPKDAPRVRAAFAKARLERARTGEWIQADDGQWIKK